MTEQEFERILRERGGRPSTPEEVKAFDAAISRTDAKIARLRGR